MHAEQDSFSFSLYTMLDLIKDLQINVSCIYLNCKCFFNV